jgi:hypothetical protein
LNVHGRRKHSFGIRVRGLIQWKSFTIQFRAVLIGPVEDVCMSNLRAEAAFACQTTLLPASLFSTWIMDTEIFSYKRVEFWCWTVDG